VNKVFVVHHQKRFDEKKGVLVETHDLTPASEYGKLVYLLPHHASPLSPDKWIPVLQSGLTSYTRDDYLLLVGNPSLIAWAAALAADESEGYLKLLQWEREEKRYQVVEADLCM